MTALTLTVYLVHQKSKKVNTRDNTLIEHTENKNILQSLLLENEVGPGVLQSSCRVSNVIT